MQQINQFERADNVMIVVDSVGNLASKKEVDDALDGKSVADMTRAKQMKSLFRMITPHLTIKDIPMVVVNHTYMEIGMFPKAIVSGGTGIYYSADNIFIIGRQQEKLVTFVRSLRFRLKLPLKVVLVSGLVY
jgi:RecA/RadA recombinase